MTNAFERLSLPQSLVLEDEELRAAFREAGKSAHPDSGGADDAFAEAREAFEILMSPSRRLKHWLDLRSIAVDERGSVDAGLIGLFGEVGSVTQEVESRIRRRDATKSMLGRALLEESMQQAVGMLETTIGHVDAAIARECEELPKIATGAVDADLAARVLRHLRFLEKWRASLRSLFPRLL